jgi:DNA-binding CsgD family transcriptional regulator
MNKLLQRLFLFEKFEFETKLSKKQILNKITDVYGSGDTYVYTITSEGGFSVARKSMSSASGVSTRNFFAPVAKCTAEEGEDFTRITGILRMKLPVLVIFAPLYLLSMLTLLLFPIVYLVVYFAFIKPAGKLKEELENALTEDDSSPCFLCFNTAEPVEESDTVSDAESKFLDGLSSLTPKERSLYECYVAGFKTSEILLKLCITENTLKFHNKNLYGKLGVSSRKQLVEMHGSLKQKS